MTPLILFLSSIVFFFASLVKGTTGFGFSLLALPLLLIFLPPSAAIPLVLGLSFASETILFFSIKRYIGIKRIAPLALGGILTVPIGFHLLDTQSPRMLTTLISVIIIIAGTLILTKKLRHIPKTTLAHVIVGALAGMIHGVSSLAGPFLASYLDGTGERKGAFHADMVISSFFLTVTALFFLIRGGYITSLILSSWLWLFPIVVIGGLLGIKIEKHMGQRKFHLVIMSLVITAGIVSLLSQLLTWPV